MNSLYESFLKLIESYQENYTGDDKMSEEFMINEIEKLETKQLAFLGMKDRLKK